MTSTRAAIVLAAAVVVLASSCAIALAQAATTPAATWAGCYHVTLARKLPARSVEFFIELSLTPSPDRDAAFVVRENRSTGFARMFRRARWSAEGAHALALELSDGFESWSAMLHGARSELTGTASYSGDAESPTKR